MLPTWSVIDNWRLMWGHPTFPVQAIYEVLGTGEEVLSPLTLIQLYPAVAGATDVEYANLFVQVRCGETEGLQKNNGVSFMYRRVQKIERSRRRSQAGTAARARARRRR